MRANVAQYVLAILMAVVLSGCYSNGRWSAPNLAFWKTSPFQSAPVAAPGTIGSPVKPSGIAANSTTAPPADYAASGVTTPPVTTQGTVMGYQAPASAYPVGQSPYTSTAPGAAPTTSPSGYAPAYTASTAGVPGASAYGTASNPVTGAGGPYGATSAATSPYATTPATSPYGAANAATTTSGGYAPAGASFDANNPVRSATAYPATGSNSTPGGNANSYAPSSDRHNASANTNRYGGSGATNQYGNPSASSTPSYGARGGSGYPADYTPRYGKTTQNNSGPSPSDAMASTGNRYTAPSNSSTPLVGSRYASPSATPPTAGSGAYAQPYSTTNASGSGYSAPTGPTSATPEATPYSPPGGFSVPSTDAAGSLPAYRPGSTRDYVPRSAAATGSSVSPASYIPPTTGTGM